MYTFYHAPGSSSFAVHIALHEVGAPFEARVIRLNHRDEDPPPTPRATANWRPAAILPDVTSGRTRNVSIRHTGVRLCRRRTVAAGTKQQRERQDSKQDFDTEVAYVCFGVSGECCCADQHTAGGKQCHPRARDFEPICNQLNTLRGAPPS